jgi:hypothetical protein
MRKDSKRNLKERKGRRRRAGFRSIPRSRVLYFHRTLLSDSQQIRRFAAACQTEMQIRFGTACRVVGSAADCRPGDPRDQLQGHSNAVRRASTDCLQVQCHLLHLQIQSFETNYWPHQTHMTVNTAALCHTGCFQLHMSQYLMRSITNGPTSENVRKVLYSYIGRLRLQPPSKLSGVGAMLQACT